MRHTGSQQTKIPSSAHLPRTVTLGDFPHSRRKAHYGLLQPTHNEPFQAARLIRRRALTQCFTQARIPKAQCFLKALLVLLR